LCKKIRKRRPVVLPLLPLFFLVFLFERYPA
jgi:hypothetical protein